MSIQLYALVKDDNVRHLVGEFQANINVCVSAITIACVDQVAGRALARSELYNGRDCEQSIPYQAIRLITFRNAEITIYGVRQNITIQLYGNSTELRYFQSSLASVRIFQQVSDHSIAQVIGTQMFHSFRMAEHAAGMPQLRFLANPGFGTAEIVPEIAGRMRTERAINQLVGQEIFDDGIRLIARIIRRFLLNRA